MLAAARRNIIPRVVGHIRKRKVPQVGHVALVDCAQRVQAQPPARRAVTLPWPLKQRPQDRLEVAGRDDSAASVRLVPQHLRPSRDADANVDRVEQERGLVQPAGLLDAGGKRRTGQDLFICVRWALRVVFAGSDELRIVDAPDSLICSGGTGLGKSAIDVRIRLHSASHDQPHGCWIGLHEASNTVLSRSGRQCGSRCSRGGRGRCRCSGGRGGGGR